MWALNYPPYRRQGKDLLVGGFAAVVEDVDDDGGADKGGDAVDGELRLFQKISM